MNDIQAALGRSQLKRLDKIVETRNQKLKYYERKLEEHENIRLLKIYQDNLSAVHLAVVLIENTTREQHRKIFEYLRHKNVGVQVHYTPIHLQPFYRKKGFTEGYLPVAEAYAESAITIPLYPELNQEEQDYVLKILCRASNMHKKSICIGTAQFGQEYGITNRESAVDKKKADLIFKIASESGINTVDTAQDYGEVKKLSGAVNT